MKTLFPDIRPYRTEMLAVSHGHELYLECSGSPEGIPVLVLHGGPGVGCSDKMRCFFDPERYHIIIFDQRGAGRSTPYADTEHNSSALILADIEQIRAHLGISRWVLFGGSFGATLALLYAQQCPEQVRGMILRGVFLGRAEDLDWLYRAGASRFFPEAWQRFIAPVGKRIGPDLIEDYYHLLRGENELAVVSAAKEWSRWESVNASLRPSASAETYYMATHTAIAMARISTHFFRQQCFLRPNQIIAAASQLAGIPGFIVHGRYDMICPPEQAWALAQHWPDGELNLVREGGHSAFDVGLIDALVGATQKLALRLGSPESEA